MNKTKMFKNIMPVILVAGISFCAQAKSIKALTSKNQSKKVEKQVEEVAMMTGNALKVHSVGVGIGQTFLGGDFADDGDNKITADLFYNYSASHSFDFMANLHYSKHSIGKREVKISGIALGIKAKLFNFDAFSPYGVGGLGFYNPVMKRDIKGTISKTESEVIFGWHAGIGAELDLNKNVKVGVMGALHNPFDVKQEGQEDVEGSYSKLMITTFYKF